MYEYMYVCMYMCPCMNACIHTFTCIHKYICAHDTHACMYTAFTEHKNLQKTLVHKKAAIQTDRQTNKQTDRQKTDFSEDQKSFY